MARRVRLYAALVNDLTECPEIVADDCRRQLRCLFVDPLLNLAVLDVVGSAIAELRRDSPPVHAIVLAGALVDVDARLQPQLEPVVNGAPRRLGLTKRVARIAAGGDLACN